MVGFIQPSQMPRASSPLPKRISAQKLSRTKIQRPMTAWLRAIHGSTVTNITAKANTRARLRMRAREFHHAHPSAKGMSESSEVLVSAMTPHNTPLPNHDRQSLLSARRTAAQSETISSRVDSDVSQAHLVSKGKK